MSVPPLLLGGWAPGSTNALTKRKTLQKYPNIPTSIVFHFLHLCNYFSLSLNYFSNAEHIQKEPQNISLSLPSPPVCLVSADRLVLGTEMGNSLPHFSLLHPFLPAHSPSLLSTLFLLSSALYPPPSSLHPVSSTLRHLSPMLRARSHGVFGWNTQWCSEILNTVGFAEPARENRESSLRPGSK